VNIQSKKHTHHFSLDWSYKRNSIADMFVSRISIVKKELSPDCKPEEARRTLDSEDILLTNK